MKFFLARHMLLDTALENFNSHEIHSIILIGLTNVNFDFRSRFPILIENFSSCLNIQEYYLMICFSSYTIIPFVFRWIISDRARSKTVNDSLNVKSWRDIINQMVPRFIIIIQSFSTQNLFTQNQVPVDIPEKGLFLVCNSRRRSINFLPLHWDMFNPFSLLVRIYSNA